MYRGIPLIAILSLAACGGGGSGGGSVAASSDTGSVSLSVTDAPVDSALHVLVQFIGIEVKPDDDGAIDVPLSGDSQTCQDWLDGIPPAPAPVGRPPVNRLSPLAVIGHGGPP